MKDNNFIKKLILAAAAFIAQILIVMIIIFILLNKNIINDIDCFCINYSCICDICCVNS